MSYPANIKTNQTEVIDLTKSPPKQQKITLPGIKSLLRGPVSSTSPDPEDLALEENADENYAQFQHKATAQQICIPNQTGDRVTKSGRTRLPSRGPTLRKLLPSSPKPKPHVGGPGGPPGFRVESRLPFRNTAPQKTPKTPTPKFHVGGLGGPPGFRVESGLPTGAPTPRKTPQPYVGGPGGTPGFRVSSQQATPRRAETFIASPMPLAQASVRLQKYFCSPAYFASAQDLVDHMRI